jgi:hypothetical protein
MAFTRFHDDPNRIKKSLQESTFAESYYLNKPGNGNTVPFQMDPQLRLQGWGANLCTNAINLESDFRGLTRKLNRDLEKINDYSVHMSESDPFIYDNVKPFVDESRATHPAWMYRVVENNRWEYPWINPQDNCERTFNWNVQTRILEKDSYVPRIPNISTIERVDVYPIQH